MRAKENEKKAFLTACICLAIGGLSFRLIMAQLQVYLQKESVPLRSALDELPMTFGNWKQVGKDQQLSDAVVEELGTKNYLDRSYVYKNDSYKGMIQVHIAYYTGMIDTVPHIPERCWGAAGLVMIGTPVLRLQKLDTSKFDLKSGPIQRASGMHYPQATVQEPVTHKNVTVNLPLGDITMTVSMFQDPKHPGHIFIGAYFFIANGSLTPSAIEVRNLSFKLTDRYAYYCKVQFSYRVHEQPEIAITMFDQLASDLLQLLLPQLMRSLPDWPVLENTSTQIPVTSS
ncbi:MAG: exosortase-associated EpsI family protein [Phycisphaerales bacterium]|nr:exosortase-associated EpsI family protein [Phycisphaerales bacterium]